MANSETPLPAESATAAAAPAAAAPVEAAPDRVRSRGYWSEVWRRYRTKPLPMIALGYVGLLVVLAIFSPAIAGTKPIVAYYKGNIYFPALGYFRDSWENPIFTTDRFRNQYFN